MNDDLSDLSVFHTDVLPGLATIGTLVGSIAIADGIAGVRFTSTHPDDVFIRRSYTHITDGDGGFLIELVFKGGAVVVSAKQTTRSRRYIISGRISFINADCCDAARHVSWADAAPFELFGVIDRQRESGFQLGLLLVFDEAAFISELLLHLRNLLFHLHHPILCGWLLGRFLFSVLGNDETASHETSTSHDPTLANHDDSRVCLQKDVRSGDIMNTDKSLLSLPHQPSSSHKDVTSVTDVGRD